MLQIASTCSNLQHSGKSDKLLSPMALREKRLSVRVSSADYAKLRHLVKKLLGMQESQLTKILLHYGIRYAPEAIDKTMKE